MDDRQKQRPENVEHLLPTVEEIMDTYHLAGEREPQQKTNEQYTDTDVAAYETQWDVYLETGAVKTVRKTVKRIDSIGVLRVAFERAAHSLSESTLEERRAIILRRIRQLERAP